MQIATAHSQEDKAREALLLLQGQDLLGLEEQIDHHGVQFGLRLLRLGGPTSHVSRIGAARRQFRRQASASAIQPLAQQPRPVPRIALQGQKAIGRGSLET